MTIRIRLVAALLFGALSICQPLTGHVMAAEGYGRSRPLDPVRQNSDRTGSSARSARVRVHDSAKVRPDGKANPTPALFVSATRIESDGDAIYPVMSGHFSTGPLPSIVTVIHNTGSPTGFYLAVMLDVSGQLTAPILTPASFAAGDLLVVGDVNKDTLDDVVLVHPGSIDVLTSMGDGTFAGPQNIGTGLQTPVAAALWDVDHNSIPDLVIVDSGSNQAAFLLGDGLGGFEAPQLTSFPGHVSIGVLADIDSDGNLDLVTNDTVYPGDGKGGFLPGISFESGDGQNAGVVSSAGVAVGDLNQDGKLDVVTANGDYNTVSVFMNRGGRLLVQQGASVWSGNDPEALTMGYVDVDRKLDLVVMNAAESDVSILLGKGDGSFFPPNRGYATGGSPSTRPVLADFNGDGVADFAVSDNQSSVVYALGNGDGTFQAAPVTGLARSLSGTSGSAISIATGDFNGDGVPDTVVGQDAALSTGVIVFLTNPNGSIAKGVIYGKSDALRYVATGTFSSNGKTDIVASNATKPYLELLRGNGDGTFAAPSLINIPGVASHLIAADFNGDGFQDIAAVGKDPVVYVLLNDGAGSFDLAGTYPISGVGSEVVASDINNDGKIDLCLGMSDSSHVAILLGKGDGSFSAVPDYDTTLSSLYGIAVGDLDRDGFNDLVVTSPSDGYVAIAMGNGNGSFYPPRIFPASFLESQLNPTPREVRLADLNGDGALDVVFTNQRLGSVAILQGDGYGDFWPEEFPTGGGAWGLAVSGLEKGMLPDLITANSSFSGVSVSYHRSGTPLTPDFILAIKSGTLQVPVGGSAATTISLSSNNEFVGTVTLGCASVPAILACSLTPSSLQLSSDGTASAQVTVLAHETLANNVRPGRVWLALAMFPILGGTFFGRSIRRKGAIALLSVVIFLTGCGGLAPARHHPSQNYTIAISATSWNGVSHSIPVQISVQQ